MNMQVLLSRKCSKTRWTARARNTPRLPSRRRRSAPQRQMRSTRNGQGTMVGAHRDAASARVWIAMTRITRTMRMTRTTRRTAQSQQPRLVIQQIRRVRALKMRASDFVFIHVGGAQQLWLGQPTVVRVCASVRATICVQTRARSRSRSRRAPTIVPPALVSARHIHPWDPQPAREQRAEPRAPSMQPLTRLTRLASTLLFSKVYILIVKNKNSNICIEK
jgi:hypothetical protein